MAGLDAQGPAGSYTPQGLPTEITQVRFNAGQAVVPYFEGWIKNPDGTFDMVFGYFNRNYQQEFAIPVGPENKVEPLTGDAGQPTYFLPETATLGVSRQGAGQLRQAVTGVDDHGQRPHRTRLR